MLHKVKKITPWLICITASIFYSYEYLLRITPSLIKAQFMFHHDIGPTTFGVIASLYYLAYTPMQLAVGILMDYYGPRKLLTFACFSCVVGIYCFASKSLYLAGSGLFLVGLGSAFAFVGVLKLATIWLPPERLAMISGFTSALGKVGAIFGNLVISSIIIKLTWLNTLYQFALVGLLLTVFMFVIIKDKNPASTDDTVDFKVTIQNFKYILLKKQMWLNGIISSLIYLPTTIFANLWGRTYLVEVNKFTEGEASIAISILFAGFAIGAPLAGYISDKLRLRRMPIIIGSFFAVILFAVLILFSNLSIYVVYVILFILGLMCSSHVISFPIGREISPANSAGTALAVTNMIVMLGGLVFTPLSGALIELGLVLNKSYFTNMNEYQFAMGFIIIGMLAAFVMSFALVETRCKLLPKKLIKR